MTEGRGGGHEGPAPEAGPSFEERYQRVLDAEAEVDRLMRQLDAVLPDSGGDEMNRFREIASKIKEARAVAKHALDELLREVNRVPHS